MVNLRERQLFALLVALTFVARQVDRLCEQVRLIEPVKLLLDRFHSPLALDRAVLDLRRELLPDIEDAILDQPHVAGRGLQQRELVGEGAFELGLAHVDRATLALAMVVRVMAVAALGPAASQRTAAGFAADKTTQRKVRMIALPATGNNDAAVENGLCAVVRRLIDDRLEVALH